jgi:hypothetical protein
MVEMLGRQRQLLTQCVKSAKGPVGGVGGPGDWGKVHGLGNGTHTVAE